MTKPLMLLVLLVSSLSAQASTDKFDQNVANEVGDRVYTCSAKTRDEMSEMTVTEKEGFLKACAQFVNADGSRKK